MKVAIFFVQLWLFLLQGGNELHALTPARSNHHAYTCHYQIEIPSGTVVNINYINDEQVYPGIIDIEDEDTNDLSGRKIKTPLRDYQELNCQSASGYPIYISKANPSLHWRVSYR